RRSSSARSPTPARRPSSRLLPRCVTAHSSTIRARGRTAGFARVHDYRMGIRYYAYPVSPREMAAARENPCRFHGDDPLMDAWGPAEERPPMLYLDKCWRCLQRLFDLDGPAQRPAAELVRGDVTHVPTGWIPYERALHPSQVAEIAAD